MAKLISVQEALIQSQSLIFPRVGDAAAGVSAEREKLKGSLNYWGDAAAGAGVTAATA
jgi:hypothetical protein